MASASASGQGEAICFSLIANLRCQGISRTETIAAFVPSAVELLLVPTLLAVAWTRPRSTLILLAAELTLTSGLSIWDLILRLGLGSGSGSIQGETFQVEDTALAITSSLPTLFFLLFLTSHILTDVRPYLPSSFKSRSSTHIFVICIAPLIPIGFVGALLPSFLLLVYTPAPTTATTTTGDDGDMQIGFGTTSDERLHQILSDAGAIATGTYTLFILLLTIVLLLLSLSSRSTTTTTSRVSQSQWPRWVLALALFLAASEISLAVIPPSSSLPGAEFLIIIIRKSVRLLSRLMLVVGLVALYRPGTGGDLEGGGEGSFEIIASTSRKEKGNRDTVSTFGTPLTPPSQADFHNEKKKGTNTNVPNDLKNKDKKGMKKPKPTPLKLQIGNPIEGTLKKMDTSATRGFYALHSARMKDMGMGMGIAVDGNGTPKRGGGGERAVVAPIGRVVFRTPAARAPVLSFTSSIFDSSALEGLVRETQPQAAYTSISTSSAQVLSEPRTALTNTTLTKKFTGSIYAPSRVSIEESMLSQWPPAPAPPTAAVVPQLRSNTPGGQVMGMTARGIMGAAALGTVATGQLSQSQSQLKIYRNNSNTGSKQRGIRITIPDHEGEGDEAIAMSGPIITHPYQYQNQYQYHSPAISREPSETSETSREERSAIRQQQSSAPLLSVNTPTRGEDLKVKVGAAPRYKVTDVITPVNTLPRVNSVRRKPVPEYQYASPSSTAGTGTGTSTGTTGNALGGGSGGGGIEVRQYFTSGARRSLIGSTHKRWNSSSTSASSASSGASDASQRSQLHFVRRSPTSTKPPMPMPKRKSTDPTMALSSSPPRSLSNSQSQLSNSDTRVPFHGHTRMSSRETIMSPSSEYSHTLASPIDKYNDNDRKDRDRERERERALFFSTPVQSPSEDDHSVPVPFRQSIHFNDTQITQITQVPPLPKNTAITSVYESESGFQRQRQSDVRAVPASLSRLQKDAGIETDLSRLTMITNDSISDSTSLDFGYDITDTEAEAEAETQGQIRYSLSSVDSDDLTPKAEVMPRPTALKMRNYGGVV